MEPWMIKILLGLGGILLFIALKRRAANTSTRNRLRDPITVSAPVLFTKDGDSALKTFLIKAGHRGEGAVSGFLISVALSTLIGIGGGLLLASSSLMDRALLGLMAIPGGFSGILAPVIRAAPVIIGLIVASLPWVVVRAARRRRVAEIEQDLPVTLELIASLGEAGQGFDASLERVLDAQNEPRVLGEELATYRAEKLAGLPGVRALRRLAHRIDVPSMSMLVSALVQAEQVGSSIANTLRSQADDLRHRRRLEAQARAQALPVRLMVPLVVCFLPPIFVVTLGPAFVDLARVIDSVTR